MKLITKIWQHRFDFVGIYQCEHCGKRYQADGYEDQNFYQNIIPNAVCDNCNDKSDKCTNTQEYLSRCSVLNNCPTCGHEVKDEA